jgi:hypothetical protein
LQSCDNEEWGAFEETVTYSGDVQSSTKGVARADKAVPRGLSKHWGYGPNSVSSEPPRSRLMFNESGDHRDIGPGHWSFRGLEIGVDEAIAVDDFSGIKSNGMREHGAVVDAGVELAVLATGVDRGG